MAEIRRVQEEHEHALQKIDVRIAELKAQYLEDFASLKTQYQLELETGLAKGAATIRSLESQLIDANAKNEALEKSSARRLELRSTQMLQEAELAQSELKEKLRKMLEEKQIAEKRLANAEADRQAHIQGRSSAEGTVASLTEKIHELEGTVVASTSKNEVLMETILSLTEKNKSLECELREVGISSQKALQEISSNQQENEAVLAGEQSAWQEQKLHQQKALTKAQQRENMLVSESKELQEQRALLKKQVRDLEAQLRLKDKGPCLQCQQKQQPEQQQPQRKPSRTHQSESMSALPSISQSPGPMLPEGALRGPMMQQGAMRFIKPKDNAKGAGTKSGAVRGPNAGSVSRWEGKNKGQSGGPRVRGGLDQALRNQGPGPSRRRR
jgi:hypothetical protein